MDEGECREILAMSRGICEGSMERWIEKERERREREREREA